MALIPWSAGGARGPTLASLREEMNDLLSRFWTTASEPFGLAEWSPPLDLSETGDAVLVHVELPGVDPKEVEISVTGDVLTIRGEKKDETAEKGRHYHRVERRYGSFTRSLTLPAAVDADGVEAKIRSGILELRLPKKEEARARRVEVRAE
jgi:HSP20 family protein